MSTTMQGIDARYYLNGWMSGLVNMFIADINAIPEDKWNSDFGGCTRPTYRLAADATAMLFWVAEAIKGNIEAYGPETIDAMADAMKTREGAIAKITEGSEALAAAITAASDEKLNSTVMAPWGMETPLFTMAHIAVSHIWYHDGQLNYVQCLLGDDKVHWMD